MYIHFGTFGSLGFEDALLNYQLSDSLLISDIINLVKTSPNNFMCLTLGPKPLCMSCVMTCYIVDAYDNTWLFW